MQTNTSSAERQSYNDRRLLGHPATYHFGGASEPVRLLKVTRAGDAIVIRATGDIQYVNAERVRVVSRRELP